jgi:hypothetical protein
MFVHTAPRGTRLIDLADDIGQAFDRPARTCCVISSADVSRPAVQIISELSCCKRLAVTLVMENDNGFTARGNDALYKTEFDPMPFAASNDYCVFRQKPEGSESLIAMRFAHADELRTLAFHIAAIAASLFGTQAVTHVAAENGEIESGKEKSSKRRRIE